ncbi:NAD-dependent epimerase/dehydratase family protein [Marinitenerispora sediminis]|uniref:Epimerase n=1 Tax=Marinitenerispora sediminis TaxID=1931232 RepID=A0A368SYK7_9ACTN|nr:NAD-dependent epimerase/dehydratase family protein [Marinitenerispora sediminis]RCV47905.1 epimerase [Marinitenerispora sediminis]RCV49224.1 epimerase [Marinitenerispora sediminis]RCV50256.1 epimerase [Marinitenerispora sediminis]
MLRRVLVTGSSGMLGTALVERLARDGCETVGLDLVHPAGSPLSRQVRGDVRDPDAVRGAARGVDLVVHSASALPSYSAAQIDSIVVGGTRTVLTEARRLGIPRVVHLSTGSVYGLPTLVPTPETHPRQPVDAYGRAKARAEELAEEFRADGMVVPVLRPKTFVGPGRLGIFSMLFEWAEEGRNFPVLGSGDNRNQMLDVEDLVDAVLRAGALPDDVVNTEFNVGAAEFGTLREDFQAVLDAASRGRRVVSLPMRPAVAALELLARAGVSPVYRRLIHKLCADSYMDIRRIRDRLGFTPRYSNREAILRSFEWWRQQPKDARPSAAGRTSRDPWRQGALALAKAAF